MEDKASSYDDTSLKAIKVTKFMASARSQILSAN